MPEFHIIRDYRNFLYSSARPPDSSVKIDRLVGFLKAAGVTCHVWDCRNVDLSRDWSGAYVVYQSSEDRGLFYKDYIEDLILALEMRGAILVPDFFAFRSHHNKVFQEQIRQIYQPDSKIASRFYAYDFRIYKVSYSNKCPTNSRRNNHTI